MNRHESLSAQDRLLLMAYALWMDEHDGPGTHTPQWVHEAADHLEDALAPGASAQRQSEILEAEAYDAIGRARDAAAYVVAR